MRWIVIRTALFFSISSTLMIWLFLGISDKIVSKVKHRSIDPVRLHKFENSEQLKNNISGKYLSDDSHSNKKYFFSHTLSSHGSIFVSTNLTKQQKPSRQTQLTSAIKDVDPMEQLKQEIYGNNYLEELVLIGTNTEALYLEMARTQRFGHCSNWSEGKQCSDVPLLNLLLKGFRYFELTATYDPDTRFYYWHTSERQGDTLLREVSKDVREICPFAKSHPGEMIIFSLLFCSSGCRKFESEKFEDDGGDNLQWTNLYNRLPEIFDSQKTFNGSFYSNRNFGSQKSNLISSWFTNDKHIVENPIASRFLRIVASFVKSCSLSGDVSLTRTVSEILMLKTNVIFTVRQPNFLIPLTMQRIFRYDEILRKTILSEWNVKAHKNRLNNFDWVFPDGFNLETKNLRFFSQPSTLTHLRLIFTGSADISWFNKWKNMIIFSSGCTIFDISLVILIACLLLMIVKSSMRKDAFAGMRYNIRKLNLFKNFPLKLSSLASSVAMIYFLYTLFFFCFLLANLYAYQCFSRVILPFSHKEMQSNLNPDKDDFREERTELSNSSNDTSTKLQKETSIYKTFEDEICDSIIWVFRRWLGRPYGKRVNIVSIVANFPSKSSVSNLLYFQNQLLQDNTSLLQVNEFDMCTRNLVEFAAKINYNQISKYILIKHSGSPGGKNLVLSDCAPALFRYEVSSEGEIILTGVMAEGDEIILEEDKLPRNSVLDIHAIKHTNSLPVFLYSEVVGKLMKDQTDVFLRGTVFKSGGDRGFAYVSNRSDVTTALCQMQHFLRDSVLRLKSWNE